MSLSDAFCVERHRDDFLKFIAERVDILFANEEEILSLFQLSSFDEACKTAAQHCEISALTRSEKGSVIVNSGDQIAVPAFPVEKVVDTTGAGDLYAAGFLYGFANKQNLKRCGELASLAAAEIISHLGARPETPLDTLAIQHNLVS